MRGGRKPTSSSNPKPSLCWHSMSSGFFSQPIWSQIIQMLTMLLCTRPCSRFRAQTWDTSPPKGTEIMQRLRIYIRAWSEFHLTPDSPGDLRSGGSFLEVAAGEAKAQDDVDHEGYLHNEPHNGGEQHRLQTCSTVPVSKGSAPRDSGNAHTHPWGEPESWVPRLPHPLTKKRPTRMQYPSGWLAQCRDIVGGSWLRTACRPRGFCRTGPQG